MAVNENDLKGAVIAKNQALQALLEGTRGFRESLQIAMQQGDKESLNTACANLDFLFSIARRILNEIDPHLAWFPGFILADHPFQILQPTPGEEVLFKAAVAANSFPDLVIADVATGKYAILRAREVVNRIEEIMKNPINPQFQEEIQAILDDCRQKLADYTNRFHKNFFF